LFVSAASKGAKSGQKRGEGLNSGDSPVPPPVTRATRPLTEKSPSTLIVSAGVAMVGCELVMMLVLKTESMEGETVVVWRDISILDSRFEAAESASDDQHGDEVKCSQVAKVGNTLR
jgi:hypothetical protein